MHIESTKGIRKESMLIYTEVKTIKDKCKQEMDEKYMKIDTLNKEKKWYKTLLVYFLGETPEIRVLNP